MNISATQNVKLALQAVGAHRFRSLLTVLGIVIGITTVVTVRQPAHRLARGRRHLLPGTRARTTSSSTRLRGDPSQEPPKERKRRPMKPEYAEILRRWSTSVRRRRPAALHSARGRWQADHRARARLRIGEHQRRRTVAEHGRDLAARFRRRPLLHAGGRSARRARRGHRLQRGGVALSRRQRASAAPS